LKLREEFSDKAIGLTKFMPCHMSGWIFLLLKNGALKTYATLSHKNIIILLISQKYSTANNLNVEAAAIAQSS
jgi:hypothetical protein